MRWFPSGSMAERSDWSRAHPGLAGLWFGLLFGIAFGAFFASFAGVAIGLSVGLASALVGGAFFGLAIRNAPRWFDRADAGSHPPPTGFRPWTRASDRMVTVMFCFSAVGILYGIAGIARGRGIFTALQIAFYGWIGATAGSERARRRRGRK